MKDEERARSINVLNKEEKMSYVKEHPWAIKYLVNQDEDVVIEALRANPKVLCLVRRQTEQECKIAVLGDYTAVAYARELTHDLVHAALDKNVDAKYYLPEDWFNKVK